MHNFRHTWILSNINILYWFKWVCKINLVKLVYWLILITQISDPCLHFCLLMFLSFSLFFFYVFWNDRCYHSCIMTPLSQAFYSGFIQITTTELVSKILSTKLLGPWARPFIFRLREKRRKAHALLSLCEQSSCICQAALRGAHVIGR